MRKTKIICTIGPVTESYDMLEQLANAGMNVVRLNMSHGDHESHARVIKAVRTLNKKRHHPIAVLIDTQCPEIRTGDIHNELDLKQGDEISVVARGEDDVEASSIRINYENLIDDVEIGDKITVDNGLINLEVLSKEDRVTMPSKDITHDASPRFIHAVKARVVQKPSDAIANWCLAVFDFAVDFFR